MQTGSECRTAADTVHRRPNASGPGVGEPDTRLVDNRSTGPGASVLRKSAEACIIEGGGQIYMMEFGLLVTRNDPRV